MTVTRLAAALAVVIISTAAQAADPQSCGIYARDFTAQIQNYIRNRSYNYCLVRDQVPDLPQDFETEIGIVLPDAPPAQACAVPGPISGPAEVCARVHLRVVWRGRYSWRCR